MTTSARKIRKSKQTRKLENRNLKRKESKVLEATDSPSAYSPRFGLLNSCFGFVSSFEIHISNFLTLSLRPNPDPPGIDGHKTHFQRRGI